MRRLKSKTIVNIISVISRLGRLWQGVLVRECSRVSKSKYTPARAKYLRLIVNHTRWVASISISLMALSFRELRQK